MRLRDYIQFCCAVVCFAGFAVALAAILANWPALVLAGGAATIVGGFAAMLLHN